MSDEGVPFLPAWSRESKVLRLDRKVSLDDLSPEWAWGEADGKGVTVGIVDSGVEADHPDLQGAVDVGGGVMVDVQAGGEIVLVDGPHDDVFGHGTACASVVHRLAPAARIVSIRVFGARGRPSADAFIRGLHWAVDHGIEVVNLSLGTPRRDWALALYEVCDRAYFANTLVVTAANNMARLSYPSLFASVCSVASNTGTDPFRFHYNPEPPTEFLAPGIDVDVAWKGHTHVVSTGNSYAAPAMAGIAALIRSKHPSLRPFQVKTVLWATAANVREAGTHAAAGRLTRATFMASPAASRIARATRLG